MLYTGGTTGMPKGVMWRQDDLFRNLVGGRLRLRLPRRRAVDLDIIRERVQGPGPSACPPARSCTAPGCMTQLIVMCRRRLRRSRSRAAASTSRSCSTPSSARSVNMIAIVGDAFGKPILRALEAEPEPLGPVEPLHHHARRA